MLDRRHGARGIVAMLLLAALVGTLVPPARGEGPAAAEQPALERAKAILAEIERRGGEPPPGHVGGRTFYNRERRLPPGHYREYDVNPQAPGRPRDAERIIINQRTGKAYYTGNHYRTFVPLNSR